MPVIRRAFTVRVVNCWLGMTRLVAVLSMVQPQYCYEYMYICVKFMSPLLLIGVDMNLNVVGELACLHRNCVR